MAPQPSQKPVNLEVKTEPAPQKAAVDIKLSNAGEPEPVINSLGQVYSQNVELVEMLKNGDDGGKIGLDLA